MNSWKASEAKPRLAVGSFHIAQISCAPSPREVPCLSSRSGEGLEWEHPIRMCLEGWLPLPSPTVVLTALRKLKTGDIFPSITITGSCAYFLASSLVLPRHVEGNACCPPFITSVVSGLGDAGSGGRLRGSKGAKPFL